MDEPLSGAPEGNAKDSADGKGAKKPVPATLVEFLKGDVPASAYVSALIERTVTIPDEAERERALEAVIDEPKLLPRVITLARTALGKSEASRIKGTISAFASNVVRSQDKALADWSTFGGRPAEADLVPLVVRVREARAAGDKDSLQKAEQVFQLGMAVVSARLSFDPVAALVEIYSQLSRGRDRTGSQPEAIVKEAVSRASLKNLETYGSFHAVLSQDLGKVRKQLADANHDLADQRERVRALREQVAAQKQEIDDLQAEKQELAKRLADAISKIEGVKGGRDDELNTLRARSRQLLQRKLTPFVSDAQAALELEPPVKTVAQDRLDRIKSEIEGELEWLNQFLD